MGVKLIARGVGKGSLFGYGRLFGVHNPLGSKIGKAKDPYINLWTLSRLSRSPQINTKNAAIENFSNRLKGPVDKITVKRIFAMDHRILIEVLSKDIYTHPWLQKPILDFIAQSSIPGRRPVRNKNLPEETYRKALIRLTSYPEGEHPYLAMTAFFQLCDHLTSSDLEEIAKQGPSTAIVDDMLGHGCMNRNIACYLANADYKDESVNERIYKDLQERLSPEELDILSQSKSERIKEYVCFNRKAGPATVAKAVHGLMQERGILEYDCSGKSHRIYKKHEIDRACIYIIVRKEGLLDILAEIKKLDSELALSMVKRIQSNEPLVAITEPKKYI